MTYYLPEGNLKQFEIRMARLIKRATKLGSPLSYVINRDDFRDEKAKFIGHDGKEKEVFVRRFRCEVTGEEPKYAGWKFIGTLEHTDEGNVLRMVPGQVAPPQYRDCAPFCEHCKLKRTRKDTFLVHHVENNTTTQVGSNCLVDFLGHENPQSIAKLAEIWVNLNELTCLAEDAHWLGGGGNYINKDRQDLPLFLAYVAEIVIQTNQFWSRSAVSRIAAKRGSSDRLPETTSSLASRCLNPYGPEDRKDSLKFEPSEAAIKLADDARNWVLSQFGEPLPESGYDAIKSALLHAGRPELNDFEHNLLVVAKGEFCERRTFGIAAYIVEAYRRANGMSPYHNAAKKPVRPVSQHFGKVGDRFAKLEVTCEKVHTWESEEYGTGSLFKLRTAEGNMAVWRTYNVSSDNNMEEGRKYVIAATVKEHGDYNSEKQTAMSRVKVILGLLRDTAVAAPAPAKAKAPQPESLEPGDDFVPTTLQLVAA